jgi:hypothetical protein
MYGYIYRSPPPVCQYTGGVPIPPSRAERRRGSAARLGCWASTDKEKKYLSTFLSYTSRCLDVTSTHKPTMLHSNPHETPTKFFVHCNNLLLLHFDPVTIFYCDIPTQSGWTFCPPQKMGSLSQCDNLTHCSTTNGCDILSTSDFYFCCFFALDFTMRFLAFEGTVARGFPPLVGL